MRARCCDVLCHYLPIVVITLPLIETGLGLLEVTTVLRVCKITELVNEIETLAKELVSGPAGVVTVIVKETINIIGHGADLTEDIKVCFCNSFL